MLKLTLTTGPIMIAARHIVAVIPEATETLILTVCGVIYYVKETEDEIGKSHVWNSL